MDRPSLEDIYLRLTGNGGPAEPRKEHTDGHVAHRSPRRDAALLWHQIRYEQLSFWRNPQSAFFTFVFPVVIIVMFGALFRASRRARSTTAFPACSTTCPRSPPLSVLGAVLQPVGHRRCPPGGRTASSNGSTPPRCPPGTYFTGLLAHCILVSIIDVVLIIGIGHRFRRTDAHAMDRDRRDPLVLGAACFCALGVAVASLIRNAEAAPAVVQFVLFPLVFVSGTYLPIHSDILNHIASILPVRPLNQALPGPFAQHTGVDWPRLGVLVAWGVIGAVIAIRRFRWDPRPE